MPRRTRPSTAPVIGLVGLTMLVAACVGSPTSTPSASSASLAASPGPSRTPVPTLALPTTLPASATLAVDSWAEVVVDRLNIRERAGTDAASLGLLPAGSHGMIAAGPVEADGYDWYALAAPGLPYASGCATNEDPSILDCPIWFGWVASSDDQGNPWVVPAELECPAAPTTIAEMIGIQPGVRLACFSGQTFVLDAYLSPVPGGRGCFSSGYVTPSWLDCEIQFLQGTATEQESQGPELAAHLHPSAGMCDFGGRSPATCPYVPFIGQWIQVDAHLDDAAATTCEGHLREGMDPRPIDPAMVVYGCRVAIVVTAVGSAN